MLRRRIAVILLFTCSGFAFSQSAETTRHAGARTTSPVTITADDPAAKPTVGEADPEKAAQKAKEQKIHSLLDRAYALTEQLSPEQRAQVLSEMLPFVGEQYKEKALDWALDLWNTANDVPDDIASQARDSALAAMAHVDPDKALTYLSRLKSEPNSESTNNPRFGGSPGDFMAVLTVFNEVHRKHGDAALPKLQDTARAMGSNGAYPYRAMAGQVERLTEKKSDDASPEAPPDARAASIFRDAFLAYQSAPKGANDIGFSEFLVQTARRLPHDQAVEALDAAVRNMLTVEPDSNSSGQVRVGEKTITFKGRSDYALLRLMPIIKQLDPPLLAQVLQARPDFADAQDGRFRGLNPGGYIGPPPDKLSPEMRQQVQRMNTRRSNMRLARNNPDAALATAASMTDAADKANLLADTARFMAEDDPEQAAKVLDQAQKAAAEIKDQDQQMRVIVVSAQAAHQLKQTQRVRSLMAQGFDIGSQLMRKEVDEHPETGGDGGPLSYMKLLISYAIADDPDGVLAAIDPVPYPMAKAMLYSTGARWLVYGERSDGASVQAAAGSTTPPRGTAAIKPQ